MLRVGALLNAAGLIFRETPNADVGIDGYVELVDENGNAKGASIAVQIKSGGSYFIDGGNSWKYYPSEKHQTYWEMYPLPVILMLHDPRTDHVYWSDVRLQLRSDSRKRSPLLVPKNNFLRPESAETLFANCGSGGRGPSTVLEALRTMVSSRNSNASFPLSFLDIFLEGLTDIGRKLFFSAGMCWDLAEIKLPEDAPTGVGMCGGEQEFLDAYLRFLVEEALAHIDYSDVMIDLHDREMFPTLLVPLTSRGRALRDLCRSFGACGNRYEITEASVGLLDRITNVTRAHANFAVAKKLAIHFAESKSDV